MGERKILTPGGFRAEQASGASIAAIYSSHPIAKFKLGRYQFDRGVLKLNAEDATDFDKLLADQPPAIRSRVRKSSLEDAERIAAQYLGSRKLQGITTTADDAMLGGPGSTLLPEGAEGDDVSHANPLHPGASKDKLTDGSAEPELGVQQDKIDPFDGDTERRVERNAPVQMADQVAGINQNGTLNATGASVAEAETARNQPDPVVAESQERAQEGATAEKKGLFNLGNKGDKPETQPVREGD